MGKLSRILLFFIKVFPFLSFFSYHPVISFGSNESMNFEFSLPLIGLVVFDVIGLLYLIKTKKLFSGLKGKWMWLLFPGWVLVSVIWSLNSLRGLLTAGILWLIYFAGYTIWSVRELFDERFKKSFLKWFIIGTLVICAWCFLQCILDLSGVLRDYSLMCAGCVSQMFGFPHPNGFAIEPQFMGNLMLAPSILMGWLMLRSRPRPAGPSPRAAGANSRAAALRNAVSLKHYAIPFIIFAITLFLTFSRGAIYAFGVGMLFMTGFLLTREKGKKRAKIGKRLGLTWVLVVLSFLFTLNLQGIMAAVGPTNDTYVSGVTKALNHLSLGIIDIRGKNEEEQGNNGGKLVENSVENSGQETEESRYDGYVAESTDIRVGLTNAALTVWSSSVKNILFGVGIGGAGVALYENGLTSTPKEIVQNQYASLLLETGLVGVSLFALTIFLVIIAFLKHQNSVLLLSPMVSYGVSLLFFSGLVNALNIYLLPIIFMML